VTVTGLAWELAHGETFEDTGIDRRDRPAVSVFPSAHHAISEPLLSRLGGFVCCKLCFMQFDFLLKRAG
jgi:hypothetical protein